MVDFIPAVLFVFGVVAVFRPEWVAVIDRRQKAAGTTRFPGDIEMSETYYLVVQIVGASLALFGLVFIIRSW